MLSFFTPGVEPHLENLSISRIGSPDSGLSFSAGKENVCQHTVFIQEKRKPLESLSDEWVLEKEADGITITSQYNSDGKKVFRTDVSLEGDLDELWKLIGGDLDSRMRWDEGFCDGRLLYTFNEEHSEDSASSNEENSEKYDIMTFCTLPVGPVASRCFVVRRHIRREGDKLLVIGAADPDEALMPNDPTMVRINDMIIEQVIERGVDGNYHLIETVNIELGGCLPAWIVYLNTATSILAMCIQLQNEARKMRAESSS